MKDIYNNGEYLNNNPDWSYYDCAWKADLIYNMVIKHKLNLKNSIEVGCGTGEILNILHKKFEDVLFEGYDISSEIIKKAKASEDDNLLFYDKDFLNVSTPKSDLIIMMDVVEHVPDYYKFMEELKQKGKSFIFHIPLDLCCRSLLKPHILLQQREAVGHLHYFSKEHVFWLLNDCGYKTIDFHYTYPLLDTQPAKNIKESIKKILRKFSFSINKDLSAKLWGGYSLLILCE